MKVLEAVVYCTVWRGPEAVEMGAHPKLFRISQLSPDDISGGRGRSTPRDSRLIPGDQQKTSPQDPRIPV
eukprot:1392907-Amorphochlora_amoeboformis.AAC.1